MSVLTCGGWCVNDPILKILVASFNSLRITIDMKFLSASDLAEKDEEWGFFVSPVEKKVLQNIEG